MKCLLFSVFLVVYITGSEGGNAGCYTNYQSCYNTFSQTPTPTTQDRSNYCSAASTAVACFKNDASGCAPSTPVPQAYTDHLQELESVDLACKASGDCLQKSLYCANITLEMANSFTNFNFTDLSNLQQMITNICPVFGRIKTCFDEMVAICPPEVTAQGKAQIDNYSAMVGSFCPNSDSTTKVTCDGGDCNLGTTQVYSFVAIIGGIILFYLS